MKITPSTPHPGTVGTVGATPPAARSGPVPGREPAPLQQEHPEFEPVQREAPLADVREATDRLNDALRALGTTNLVFNVNHATNRINVKVVNTETGEVIREIPPEKVIDAVAALEHTIGLLVDAKA